MAGGAGRPLSYRLHYWKRETIANAKFTFSSTESTLSLLTPRLLSAENEDGFKWTKHRKENTILALPDGNPESRSLTLRALIERLSKVGFNREMIVDGLEEILAAAEVAFGGLDRGMAEQELDLLEVAAGGAAEFGASAA